MTTTGEVISVQFGNAYLKSNIFELFNE